MLAQYQMLTELFGALVLSPLSLCTCTRQCLHVTLSGSLVMCVITFQLQDAPLSLNLLLMKCTVTLSFDKISTMFLC